MSSITFGASAISLQKVCVITSTSVAPDATSAGTDAMLRARSGLPLGRTCDLYRNLYTEACCISSRVAQRLTDANDALRDAFKGFAHDRDPAVAVTRKAL